MKTIITAFLCLIAGSSVAQQAQCIGWMKSALESNWLSDYQVVTKDYRQGYIRSPNEYCLYYNPNGSWRDKNLTLEFNEKDICVRAMNGCQYDDLKQMIQYMDDHFTRLDDRHWKTVDNAFLFTMNILPGANSVEIETIAMPKPKPAPKKPVAKRK